MTTIRLDTLRNQIAGTIALLQMIHQELEDLHVLAYERHTASDEAKVAGGSRDYALDTHGDPQARNAYRTLGDTTAAACETLATVTHDALNLLRTGRTPATGRRRIQLTELGDAIAAQQRRIARGDYTPIRRGPQPDSDQALNQTRRERDAALRKLTKVTAQRDKLRAKRQTAAAAADIPAWRTRRGSSKS